MSKSFLTPGEGPTGSGPEWISSSADVTEPLFVPGRSVVLVEVRGLTRGWGKSLDGPKGRARSWREACGWPARVLSRPCGEEAQRDLTCHDPLAWGWPPWSLSCGMRTEEPVTWPRHTHLGRGGQKSWCQMGAGTWEGTGLAVGTECPQGQLQIGGALPRMVLGLGRQIPRGVEIVEPREGSRG